MITLNEVKDTIKDGDKETVIIMLEALKDALLVSDELMVEITAPETLAEMHKLLVEHMSVNQKLMRLKNRVPNRRRRAILFTQAMINGVNYLK